MRRAIFLLIATLAAAACAQAQVSPYPHTVSLDGEWNYQPLARTAIKPDGSIAEDTSNLPPPGMMKIPSNWHLEGLADFNGRVRFERRFDFGEKLAPADLAPGGYELVLTLKEGDHLLSENSYSVTVVE